MIMLSRPGGKITDSISITIYSILQHKISRDSIVTTWWQNKISCDSISIACHQLPKQSMQSQLEKKFKVFELKVCPAGVFPYYPLGVFDIASKV